MEMEQSGVGSWTYSSIVREQRCPKEFGWLLTLFMDFLCDTDSSNIACLFHIWLMLSMGAPVECCVRLCTDKIHIQLSARKQNLQYPVNH